MGKYLENNCLILRVGTNSFLREHEKAFQFLMALFVGAVDWRNRCTDNALYK